MYKKIMLGLMFLPLFSSNELVCIDPVTTCAIAYIISNATVTIINNTGSAINNTCRYYFPTQADEAAIKAATEVEIANATAAKADAKDAQIDIEKSQVVLDFIEAEKKFRKCAAESDPDSEKTIIGIPIQCLELARIFIACGGKEELIKIITDLEDFGIVNHSKNITI